MLKMKAFKISHRRPNRARASNQEAGPVKKRMRVFQKAGESFQTDGET